MDEEQVVRSATGIRNTVVWHKLFKFQRDGVVGAIDKLNRFGGCIIADSVGLGKTFEALAIIKYHELRNDRVLVLCPKRLRENWSVYRANDRRNIMAADRFNYDILNHTDLSRDGGLSGDIDLAYLNWGNYDLVVIDESHNFRNKHTPRQSGETRYDRLMRRIIREGVKTRVLMLSATPVNNRLADLAIRSPSPPRAMTRRLPITASPASTPPPGSRKSSSTAGSASTTTSALRRGSSRCWGSTTSRCWTDSPSRARAVIWEKYYGTMETGRFPERLKPINVKPDVDLTGEFPSIRETNFEIRPLNLAAYAPLRYVLPHKRDAYDEKYSTRLKRGGGFFRQADREESLVQLSRVNALKRMESSVVAFALTVRRQLADVEATLARIEEQPAEVQEIDIADVDIEDPAFESLLVGRKVKVLLQDVDLIRWQQDLTEDRNRLATLHAVACQVSSERDAKLAELREVSSPQIQIMVVTVGAINKPTVNNLYKGSEKTGGEKPIDLICATRPVLIVDEPQSVDGGLKGQGRKALKAMNALCTLRYSATHRDQFHMVYRLDAVDAYERKLVKQIEVASATVEDAHNKPYVRLLGTKNRRGGISARVEIDVESAGRVRRQTKTVMDGDDLQQTTGRAVYRDCRIGEIRVGRGHEFLELRTPGGEHYL